MTEKESAISSIKETVKVFTLQIEQLNEWVKQEWVEQGNRREDFC